jgi:hypothetical protein
MRVSVPIIVPVAYTVPYLVFLLWYGGRGRPLTAGEADALLEQVQRNAQAVAAPADPGLFEALREVSRGDDGREFVMVNLIKYRPKALYPPGYAYSDDARAADARYSGAVVPLLLLRACLPVFVGRPIGRFLAPEGVQEWDRVILVRYRSRRDFLGMCAELAKSRADIHKWAAIEKTHAFPVRCVFSLALIRLIAACVFAFLGVLTFQAFG